MLKIIQLSLVLSLTVLSNRHAAFALEPVHAGECRDVPRAEKCKTDEVDMPSIVGGQHFCCPSENDGERASSRLANDVVCEGNHRLIVLARDLSSAVLVGENGAESKHEILDHYYTGGLGQILVTKIAGLDSFNQHTTILDIFKLDGDAPVRGYRGEQAGYGTRVIEELSCRYFRPLRAF